MQNLKDELCAKIEIEWGRNRNPDIVDELARKHPELAIELYEFFALLVELELDELNDDGGDEEVEKPARLEELLKKIGDENEDFSQNI